MKKLLLLTCLPFSLICASQSEPLKKAPSSLAALIPLYKSGWHFLEDMIITLPEAQTSNLFIGLLSFGVTGGIFDLTQKGLEHFFGKAQRPSPHNQTLFTTKNRFLISAGAGILCGYLSFYQLKKYLLYWRMRERLHLIFDEWHTVSHFLPHQVQEGLDPLRLLRKQNPQSYDALESEAIRLLKASIQDHFPNKYSEKDFTVSETLKLQNLLRLAKLTKDIIF
jgi:hypothetical protein